MYYDPRFIDTDSGDEGKKSRLWFSSRVVEMLQIHGNSFAVFSVKSLSFISVTLIGDWISEPTVSKARRLLGVCIVMIAIIFSFYEELCSETETSEN